MRYGITVLAFACACEFSYAVTALPAASELTGSSPSYVGSSSCIECHAKFYELWSTSRHGLAMQPFTPAFVAEHLTPQTDALVIGTSRYLTDLDKRELTETSNGVSRTYTIEQVLGGKNVYYFLAALEKGRLQTLPVAYDVNKKVWFDTAASGVRHFPGEQQAGEPVHWKDWQYTFNTSCYGCHVSQLATNYDAPTDTYHTTWKEPGINCETCHGPADEHVKIAKATPKDQALETLGLISTNTMTTAQRNELCASCHAKATPLTKSFKPGDRFYDHFSLVTLEDADYYPDGRDLGENYTFTSWSMSPCVKSGKLDCLHCHTSSGRYRFAKENVNGACLPCHADRVEHAEAHTNHKTGSEGNKCVSCHMPKSSFAAMNRSDHSMLPPTPAVTMAFASPNACNVCHNDKDAAWADRFVREWRTRDYQLPVLKRTALVDACRRQDWSKLGEMLQYLSSEDCDDIVAASLLRLISNSRDPRIQPVLLSYAQDSSPLLRAAALQAIGTVPTREGVQALLDGAGDDSKVVRTFAAAGLTGIQLDGSVMASASLRSATEEYISFLKARPDQWSSQYNLGNYHLQRGEPQLAIAAFGKALQIEPGSVLAMVNSALAHAQLGDMWEAETALQKALAIAPDSAAANFNMGLLQAELKQFPKAEEHLRLAFKTDPQMAEAAYNLSLLLFPDRAEESIRWCKRAIAIQPDKPKYAYTLAYLHYQNNSNTEAAAILSALLERHPNDIDARNLLREIQAAHARGKLPVSQTENEAKGQRKLAD